MYLLMHVLTLLGIEKKNRSAEICWLEMKAGGKRLAFVQSYTQW